MTGQQPRPSGLLQELQRRQAQMYGGGELDAIAELLADEIAWHVPGTSPIAGVHRGVEGVLDYFRLRRELAKSSMRITVHGELESADSVAVLAGGSIEEPGAGASWETVGVYRFAGRRLAEAWLVPLDPRHFDRIWTALGEGEEPPRPADTDPEPLPGSTISYAGAMTTELLELGSVAVARHRVPAGFDSAPLYRELPGGMCPCRHLCMLESGSLSYRFRAGGRLAMEAGEVRSVEPGHLADVREDARLIELTSLEQYRAKAEAISRVE